MMATTKRVQDTFTLDEIAKLLGVTTWEKMEEMNPDAWGYQYSEAHRQAKAEGLSDEEAEEKALEAESQARDEDYRSWKNAMEHVAETFLGYHGMTMSPLKTKSYLYKITSACANPLTGEPNWDEPAEKIMGTINGDGILGHIASLKDFKYMESTKSSRKIALEHLSWIARYADVYGVASAKRMMENRR